MESADPPADSSVPSVVDAFGIDDPAPYEVQQTVHRYLSQETRHNILQVILGHPSHLVSTTEFAYYVPGSRSAISDQFADLADHEIVTQDHHESNTDSRDIPAEFWGLTEFGVALLHEYNYLRGLPVVRAVHDATRKTKRLQRHENAPRPSLPSTVHDALDYDEPETSTEQSDGEGFPGNIVTRQSTLMPLLKTGAERTTIRTMVAASMNPSSTAFRSRSPWTLLPSTAISV